MRSDRSNTPIHGTKFVSAIMVDTTKLQSEIILAELKPCLKGDEDCDFKRADSNPDSDNHPWPVLLKRYLKISIPVISNYILFDVMEQMDVLFIG